MVIPIQNVNKKKKKKKKKEKSDQKWNVTGLGIPKMKSEAPSRELSP